MMKKIQKFGGAMLAPVLLFTYASIIIGIATVCTSTVVCGDLAKAGTTWYNVWSLIDSGARTIIKQTPLIFAIGLPIGLAKKENARCCMEVILLYLTFNYFINAILTTWGVNLGIDIASTAKTSGLTSIAGIRTLDTGVIGALVVSGVVVFLHNKYYDVELPEILGIFQGTCFIGMIGFVAMLALAVVFVFVWPKFQVLMTLFQTVLSNAGTFGVWLYGVLLKLLLPFGLHHFIYTPIEFDSIVVEGGTIAYWTNHLSEFAATTESLKTLFPAGGFGLKGLVKVFGSIGACLALYSTARPEKKKAVLSILIPATFTAAVAGITEPLEYTFLFVAPGLFIVHALLSGTIMAVEYSLGVVGNFGSGILGWITTNYLPLWHNHWQMYVVHILVGLAFVVIWWIVFRFIIIKFDLKTPGRESDEEDTRLISKKEYKEAKNNDKKLRRKELAAKIVEGLGGKENIVEATNCMTRIRATVKDETLVKENKYFIDAGTKGLIKSKDAVQVIVGVDVAYVKAEVEELLK